MDNVLLIILFILIALLIVGLISGPGYYNYNYYPDKFTSESNNAVNQIVNFYNQTESESLVVSNLDVTNLLTASVVPSKTIIMINSTIIPNGWVLCDGNNGTPDLRNRFVIGASSSFPFRTTGGEETHVLTVNELPSHDHTYGRSSNINTTLQGNSGTLEAPGTGTGQPEDYPFITQTTPTSNTGGNQAHNNMPPYYSAIYIMKL